MKTYYKLQSGKRKNQWRVVHKATNMFVTKCGEIAAVTKSEAEHWRKLFEQFAPSDLPETVIEKVRAVNLHKAHDWWLCRAVPFGEPTKQSASEAGVLSLWPVEYTAVVDSTAGMLYWRGKGDGGGWSKAPLDTGSADPAERAFVKGQWVNPAEPPEGSTHLVDNRGIRIEIGSPAHLAIGAQRVTHDTRPKASRQRSQRRGTTA